MAAFFAQLERSKPGYDVIADCGRLATSAPPWPLLLRADLVLLVVRVTNLRTIAPAAGTVEMLRRELTQHGQGPERSPWPWSARVRTAGGISNIGCSYPP
ncbi:hypothetical protein NKG94_17370 [Micromonospora sp. M12]